MKLGIGQYLRAAFNARPSWMLVAPNWIYLAAVGLLGMINPGIWVLGVGVELLYLFLLSTHKRFQNLVNGQKLLAERNDWTERLRKTLLGFSPDDQRRYQLLERRCQSILERANESSASPELLAQGEGLGRLLWIYLRLLSTKQQLARLLREGDSIDEPIDSRVKLLEKQVNVEGVGDDLRRSLAGQIDILQQRLQSRREAREKLAFVESELTRIQDQIELIREQAVLTEDAHSVSARIDSIGAGLSQTNQWIRDQQRVLGRMDDLLDAPPPLLVDSARASQSQ